MISEQGPGESIEHSGTGTPGRHLLCSRCDWHYVIGGGQTLDRCPRCTSPDLVPLDATEDRSLRHTPELVLPFSVTSATLTAQIERFAQGIPFPPPDLNPQTLQTRLQPLYLPMWLVDCDVTAQWRAEVGFDYEVLSHQERYADGAGWQTNEVHETRIRWEPRAGALQRHYENTVAPAQETHAAIERALGGFRLEEAAPFRPEMLAGAAIRVPDRAPETAWPDAEITLRERAAEECRQAVQADHLRDFRWAPDYTGHHWTLLLLPVLTATYPDDDGQPQRVLINGQTGQVHGARRGSSARATQRAMVIGGVALTLFILSLAATIFSLLLPPLLIVGMLGALVAVLVGVAAVIPVARVWAFNRRHQQSSPEV